jgi:7SK snRNA methylphosphate capping enzyme
MIEFVGRALLCFARMKSTRRYYDYRKDSSNDRLRLFDKKWFQGKTCLDIGCSSGLVTLEIARLFSPRRILGIDPLEEMIHEAINHLHNLPKPSSVTTVTSFLPRCLKNSLKVAFPQNCHFQCQSILTYEPELESEPELEIKTSNQSNYETITCLNVTKWIHLYEGDTGLIQLFWKIWELLKCEGMVILEYQPWSSYVKNRNTTSTTKENFCSLRLRPECFEELLTRLIGFEIVCRLGTSLEEAKGFNRPILVLKKPNGAHLTREAREMSVSLSSFFCGEYVQSQQRLRVPLESQIVIEEKEEIPKHSKKKKRKLKENEEITDLSSAVSGEGLVRKKRAQVRPPSQEEWVVLVDRSASNDQGDEIRDEDKAGKSSEKKKKKRSKKRQEE